MSPKNNSDSVVSVTPSPSTSPPTSQALTMSNRCRPVAMLDRERFYLDQIKQLEAERNQLRKDTEKEKQKALAANDRLVVSLEESQCKLEAMADSLSEVRVARDDLEYRTSVERAELQRRLREAVTQSDAWRAEYATLAQKCAELETDLAKCREYSESSCASLKDLAYLWQLLGIGEAETVLNGESGKGILNTSALDTDERLVDKYVRGIRAKVAELQKKDSAYQQTLQEADKIVADVEQRYQVQIADLQTDANKLREKLASMERICDQLRRGLKLGSQGSHNNSPANTEREMILLEKLVDAENCAMKWKEKAFDMEKTERTSSVRIMELEKQVSNLRMDLCDQDQLVTRMNQLQDENSQLQIDYNFLAVTRRQLADVESRNKLLECRVEELDSSEKTLQETVDRAMDLLRSKDDYFEGELGALKRKLDEAKAELVARDAEEAGWKSEAQTLNEALAGKELEVKRQRGMIHSMEECHRNEITKMTNQLRQTESRIIQLQQDLSSTTEQLHNLQSHLVNEQSKYERNLVQLNLQLVVKDDEIQQIKDQLRSTYPLKVPGGENKMAEILKRVALLRESLQNLSLPKITTEETPASRFESVDAIDKQLQELSSVIRGIRGDELEHVDNNEHHQDSPQFLQRSLGEEISSARRESSSSYCSSVASEVSDISIVMSDDGRSEIRQRLTDMEEEMKKKEEDMQNMMGKLKQAEEEGAVLASQLTKTKEDLIQEKGESARLLLEVANRRNRQHQAMDELRRENAVLRNEISLLRQRILVAEEQHKKLIHLVTVEMPRASHTNIHADSGVDISNKRCSQPQSDSGVPVRRRFSAEEKAPRMMTKVASTATALPSRCKSFSYGQGMQAALQNATQKEQGLHPIVENSGLQRSTSTAGVPSTINRPTRIIRRRSLATAQAASCMSISRHLEQQQSPVRRQRSMSLMDKAPSSLPQPVRTNCVEASKQATSLPVNFEEPPRIKKPIVIRRKTSSAAVDVPQPNPRPFSDRNKNEEMLQRRHSFVSKIPRLSKRFVVRQMSTPQNSSQVPSDAKQSKIPMRRNTVSSLHASQQPKSHLPVTARKTEMDIRDKLARMSHDFIRAFKPDCDVEPHVNDPDEDDDLVENKLNEDKLRFRTTSGSSTYSCSSAISSSAHSTPHSMQNMNNNGGSSSGFNSLEDDPGNHRPGRQDEKLSKSKSATAVARKLPLVPEVSNHGGQSPLRLCEDLGAPKDFQVTRFVGDDAVLLAWEPPADDRVAGYNIFVNGEFNSRVRSAGRTKALVNGLTFLQTPGAHVLVEICSITAEGELSPSAVVQVASPNAPSKAPVRPRNELHTTKSRRQLHLTIPSSPELASSSATPSPLTSPEEERHLTLRRSSAGFGDSGRVIYVNGHRALVRSS